MIVNSPVLAESGDSSRRRPDSPQREVGGAFEPMLSDASGREGPETERTSARRPDTDLDLPAAPGPANAAPAESRSAASSKNEGARSASARGVSGALMGRGGARPAGLAGVGGAPDASPLAGPEAGGPGASGRGGTLAGAPWFAVQAVAPEARGRALAQAVQSSVETGVRVGTAPGQGADRQRSLTALGTSAEVQAVADGEKPVRAPDIVARVVQHTAARGAMAQAQRVQVDLPQQTLSAEPASLDAQVADVQSDGDVARPAAAAAATSDGKPDPVRSSVATRGRSAMAAPAAAGDALPSGGEAAPVGLGVDAPTGSAGGTGAVVQASSDAALAAGRPTEAQLGQVAVPDADHMELKVSDGDHSFRLSVAREADGLNVELKAPREIVADLRALEPDVEAALAEDGYELASFDASEEDGLDAGRDGDGERPGPEEGPSDRLDGDAGPPTPPAPAGQGRIVNRLA